MKAWYGAAATKENDWRLRLAAQARQGRTTSSRSFELMDQGKINGYICQGFNPLGLVPRQGQAHRRRSSKLKYLVVIDPLATETSSSGRTTASSTTWTPRASRPRSSACPSTCFAEEDGSLVNSAPLAAVALEGRRAAGRGQGRHRDHRRASSSRLRALYAKEGGAFPDPILNLTWPYQIPRAPSAGGAGEGVQRLGAGRRARSQGPGQVPASRRASSCPASPQLQDDGIDRLRLLDLRRLLDRGGQPDGAARHRRPERAGHHPGLGLVVAGQPAHPLQPRLLRPGRQALGPERAS